MLASYASGALTSSSASSPFVESDERLERRLLLIAPPVVLLFAIALIQLETWRMLARTFLTMWVHELGHTITAWFSGRFALPGPWVTRLGDDSMVVVAVLFLALCAIGVHGWLAERRWQVALAASLALLQILFTFFVDDQTQSELITFFGDGGMLVLGAALMLTFWAPPSSSLHKNWLRWGFLVIGAFAFSDALMTWWQASGDPQTIPYGEIEGVGHSDPTVLVFDRNWQQGEMIARYLWLAAFSFGAVALRYAVALLQIRRGTL